MSAVAICGNTRRKGCREMRPTSSLLLLLALTACLAGTVFCQDEEDAGDPDDTEPNDEGHEETDAGDDTSTQDPPTSSVPSENPDEDDATGRTVEQPEEVSENDNSTSSEENEEEELSPIFIAIPVVLVVVIITMIVCGFIINRRWKQKDKSKSDHNRYHEDKYLHDNGTEKVPMPMFEDDVPSVLELEMEDLEQWMNKDSES
uniref:Transmembrane protein 154 n=1 Tax=Esox lucius TaxID=8010 RepID=A0AAY5KZY8_ESOLU